MTETAPLDPWGLNYFAAENVAQLLEGSAIDWVSIQFNGLTVKPADFRAVAKAIRQKQIQVVFEPSLGFDHAIYQADNDRMLVPMTYFSTLELKALIVHEAAHAALDLVHQKAVRKSDSEAIAYLAQQTYYKARTDETLEGSTSLKAAGKIVNAKFNKFFKSAIRASDSEVWDLRWAIGADPTYALEALLTSTAYNGMKRQATY